MAGIFFDSFDHLAYGDVTEKWTQIQAASGTGAIDTSTIGASYGRHGSSGLRIACSGGNPGNHSVGLLVTPSMPAPTGNTFIGGVAINPQLPFTNFITDTNELFSPTLMKVRDSSVTHVWLRFNTNGTVSAYRGTTLLATTSGPLVQSVWQYVEMKVVLHATSGSVEIRFNGVPMVSVSGVGTSASAGNVWTDFGLGQLSTVYPAAAEVWFDDVYCCDGSGTANNDFLGDLRVDPVLPTAAGASTGWTPSTGANWQCVDDNPPNDDTDYNSADAVLTDTLTFPDAPVAGATILAVQVNMTARKVDAGGAQIAGVARVGGTDYVGTSRGITTLYSDVRHVFDRNPADSSVWTAAVFNAAEFGYKKTV